MTPDATSPEQVRQHVVDAAVAITRARRYVPNQICLSCLAHVYYEEHRRVEPTHDTVALTRAERDEVARRHRAVSDAEWEATKKFRRT
jgi:hypothetical protein